MASTLIINLPKITSKIQRANSLFKNLISFNFQKKILVKYENSDIRDHITTSDKSLGERTGICTRQRSGCKAQQSGTPKPRIPHDVMSMTSCMMT